jgi:hypothetical protein
VKVVGDLDKSSWRVQSEGVKVGQSRRKTGRQKLEWQHGDAFVVLEKEAREVPY